MISLGNLTIQKKIQLYPKKYANSNRIKYHAKMHFIFAACQIIFYLKAKLHVSTLKLVINPECLKAG